jgi:hypothetical protein
LVHTLVRGHKRDIKWPPGTSATKKRFVLAEKVDAGCSKISRLHDQGSGE